MEAAEAVLLVDSGYSHTSVTPILRGQGLEASIRRLDVGGKLLTNYLKELVSMRHYNMMDETHLMNQVKEAVCYISLDFAADLERTWKGGMGERRQVDTSILVDYVLPDYDSQRHGFMRAHDPSATIKARDPKRQSTDVQDFMTLGNERFAVPEILFSPSDINMKQAGLPEVIMESLGTLPGGFWPAMLANVVVVGGNALIPGLVERLWLSPVLVSTQLD